MQKNEENGGKFDWKEKEEEKAVKLNQKENIRTQQKPITLERINI